MAARVPCQLLWLELKLKRKVCTQLADLARVQLYCKHGQHYPASARCEVAHAHLQDDGLIVARSERFQRTRLAYPG